jgi:hypothetical protein
MHVSFQREISKAGLILAHHAFEEQADSARAVCEPDDIFASSTTNLFSDESYVKLATIPRSSGVKVRCAIYHVRHPSVVAEDPPIPPK